MKFNIFSTIFVAFLIAFSGLAFAGKTEKVLIQHTSPSDKSAENSNIEKGSVELEVSLAAAVAHVVNHGDCVVDADIAVELGADICYGLNE